MPAKALKPKTKRAAKVAPEDRPLSYKQTAFVRWYTSAELNGNGLEAARRAGYKGNDNTLAVVAHENLKKPNVAKAIAQAMDKALSGADITVEKVLRDLEVGRAKAMAERQYGHAIRASELQGKYLKMFTDRIEHTQTIDDLPTEELIRLLHEITEAGNLDLSKLLAGNEPANSGGVDPAGAPQTH